MKAQETITCETSVARSLAAEDLKCGDFVAIVQEILEYPSFMWTCDSVTLAPNEMVRIAWKTGECGTPLKVQGICLPFVFVKQPCGTHRTLDVRRHQLVRLTPDYARTVWKTLKQAANGLATASIA